MLMAEEKSQLDRIEQTLGTLTQKVGGIDTNLGALTQQVGGLDKNLDALALATAENFERVGNNFERIEKKMDEGFDGVNGKIEGLHRRMDAELEQKRVVEDRVSKIEVVVFPVLAK